MTPEHLCWFKQFKLQAQTVRRKKCCPRSVPKENNSTLRYFLSDTVIHQCIQC